eukprot:TRINITY_DN17877_c0_g2_i9.p1 TRINITY_DN17877_c0_g2~~TRINITY_DN17877_c0_g2_i9.p1  ORF type:complete len:421 (+),score=62.85 TRINITY_DN17877_c0_g2_i9:238-1500(+)
MTYYLASLLGDAFLRTILNKHGILAHGLCSSRLMILMLIWLQMYLVLLIIIKGRTFLVMLRFVGRGRGEFTTSVFIYFCVQDDAWVALHFIVLPSLCRDLDDPGTFMDLSVSNAHEILRLRSCAYYPKYGVGAFGVFPLLVEKRMHSEDYGVLGLRYGSENLSIGTTFLSFPLASEVPRSAWAIGRIGRLTAGVQYKPDFGIKDSGRFNNLMNWSFAVGYGLGSSSPLSPSFNFGLEFAKSSQLIASFYQHVVVQRRVKNPFEESVIVGITNYIDYGFELETRIKGDESSNSVEKSVFRVAASWQANKNFLVKGKLGHVSSSIALAFKSWWRPSFTFSISAVRDHTVGKTSFGFGIRIEDLREASYQRADPNYVMLTPTKEHLAEGIMRNIGKRPMLQSDITSGNFDNIPRNLKPIDRFL